MRRVLGVVLVLVVLAGACGGGDDQAQDVTPSPAATATAAPEPSGPEVPTATAEPTSTAAPDSVGDLSGVRVVDDVPRNPSSWVEDHGVPADGFVPIGAGTGSDGVAWMAYWVGLEYHEDPESLPAEVAEAVGWGSVRLARCPDPGCSGDAVLAGEVTSALWLGGPQGAADVAALPDGSVVMSLGELSPAWDEIDPDAGPQAGRRLWVACEDQDCSDPEVREFSELIEDPLDPWDRPRIAVSGSGAPVIAYLTGDEEARRLRVAVCADRSCDAFTSVVDIDQAVGGFDLFSDGQGRPAVLYERPGDPTKWLAACVDATCSVQPDPVAITHTQGNIGPLVREDADLAFWFTSYEPGPNQESQERFMAEPVDMSIIECLSASCDQTRSVRAMTDLASVPTNLKFPGEPFCGEPIFIGPDGLPVISWCQGDDSSRERVVVLCDDLTCQTGTTIVVPADAAGIFAQFIHTPNTGPLVLIGGERSGLRLVNITNLKP
jgi:hypothetical protein